MRELDRRAVEDYGLPGVVLMENAGRAAAEAAAGFRGRSVLVFCGGGNNGGDGLVAARYLVNAGRRVRLVLAQPPDRYAGDAAVHWAVVRRMGIPYGTSQSAQKLLKSLKDCSIIDALLGTGARLPLREAYRSLILSINAARRPVLAVDVPSGLDADSGRVGDIAVKARVTVTMALPKPGLLRPAARPWVGRLLVADIGFPKNLVAEYALSR